VVAGTREATTRERTHLVVGAIEELGIAEQIVARRVQRVSGGQIGSTREV
jgi:ABC-type dipeptide/oligopeptide/nickel transport system ATPase subunit